MIRSHPDSKKNKNERKDNSCEMVMVKVEPAVEKSPVDLDAICEIKIFGKAEAVGKDNEEKGVINCSVCLGRHEASRVTFFSKKCQHSFCYGCIREHIKVNIKYQRPINCLQNSCESTLEADSPIFNILEISRDQRHNYSRALVQHSINKQQNLKMCPKNDCLGYIDKTNKSIKCILCHTKFCSKCWRLRHDGECGQDEFLAYIQNLNLIQCSKCGEVIEKNKGCNFMTCLCGNRFCYICGNSLDGHVEGANSCQKAKKVRKKRVYGKNFKEIAQEQQRDFERCQKCLIVWKSLLYFLILLPLDVCIVLIWIAFLIVFLFLTYLKSVLFLPIRIDVRTDLQKFLTVLMFITVIPWLIAGVITIKDDIKLLFKPLIEELFEKQMFFPLYFRILGKK